MEKIHEETRTIKCKHLETSEHYPDNLEIQLSGGVTVKVCIPCGYAIHEKIEDDARWSKKLMVSQMRAKYEWHD